MGLMERQCSQHCTRNELRAPTFPLAEPPKPGLTGRFVNTLSRHTSNTDHERISDAVAVFPIPEVNSS